MTPCMKPCWIIRDFVLERNLSYVFMKKTGAQRYIERKLKNNTDRYEPVLYFLVEEGEE